jgi:MoCo/4Fe-4S cofactor protein with predicted Tat translocation signal
MGDLIKLKGLDRSKESQSSRHETDSAVSATSVSLHSPDAQTSDVGSHLEAIGRELASKTGKKYWRSLEELADSKIFREILHREFPDNASEWTDPVGRRTFMKLMGASLALAGLTACTKQPTEHIAPYVRQPEELVPGRPQFFATSMPHAGFGIGLVVESHEGRPTKVEGNKDHPASLGGTDSFSQASVLGLYDPDRSQTLTYLGDIVTWSAFLGAIRPAMDSQRALASTGKASTFRILTGTVTSPTLAYQIKTLLAAVPGAKWHQYEPAGQNNVREGSKLAFGEYANTTYRFDKADVILSLDSDFLYMGPGKLRYARDYSNRRRLTEEKRGMNRLYVVESNVTSTGAVADHRWPVRPSGVERVARAIAARVNQASSEASNNGAEKWIEAIAADLKKNRGRSIVIAGESQPPVVHALAHAMNEALGNVGNTVIHTDPIEANPTDETESLRELAQDIDAGLVDLLLILGGNPVYDAPADLGFANRLQRVALRVHLSLYKDETSQLCHWHVPEAHFLESWSDVRAFDGTPSIIQPLIAPLYSSCRTSHEVLSAFLNQPERKPYDIVREYWQLRLAGGGQEPPVRAPSGPAAATSPTAQPVTSATAPSTAPTGATTQFEAAWRRWLNRGVVESALPMPKVLTVKPDSVNQPTNQGASRTAEGYEIAFSPDPNIFDGRFANNGWLQELPKPISSLTWDNAVLVSPKTASELGLGTVADGLISNRVGEIGGEVRADRVEVQYQGRSLVAPAFILPGQPDNTLTVYLGYGRTDSGRVGNGAGFSAYELRTSTHEWFGRNVRVSKAGGESTLASTQTHHAIDESVVGKRDLIRSGTVAEYEKHPSLAPEGAVEENEHPSLFPPFEYKDYAWGMSIDLHSCIGCNACVVACQAENNIPVVGKEQVLRRREMQWIRIDAYYRGDEGNPETFFQPIPCQQCENAPCELVCPVAATSHSAEGLNDMVYNRCVGTRYCSNNCPYKVRRFNFLLYQDFYTASLKMMRNPDVSVRSRGVMEKCTYCVQRIQGAKIESEKENRQVRDGEISTACEAACPTNAIVFGNVNDKNSRVAKLKAEERNYSLLGELNTKPRTTYLAAVRNPNPELEGA